jgi:mono/diheme cytochrome c family protein
MQKPRLLVLVVMTAGAVGCGDDDGNQLADASGPVTGMDAGKPDGGAGEHDAGPHGGDIDAGPSQPSAIDASTRDAAASDAGGAVDQNAQIARGRYITTNLYPCGSCHTPRVMGAPDLTRTFAGVDCWTDTVPADGGVGCLSSRNLTNHITGIKNLSDAELKDLFLKGLRPDGKALHPQMPYAVLGNMSDADASAIVAYLRSLPPVDHMVAANQPPFNEPPTAPAARWPEADIPQPRPDYPDQAAAKRGRYLAGTIGNCLDCHTTRDPVTSRPDTKKTFQGGRTFGTNPVAWAPNLTPHETGIKTWTVEDVLRALKFGEDADQDYSKFCGPMPSGPNGAYGGITDADARDIGHYLLSLPPVDHMVAGDCQPAPDAGAADAGVLDGGS